MKTRIYGVLALLLLVSSGLFFSCSDDDEARTFPAYPLNVQAQQDSADPGGVVLTWDEVEDVFNYVIYRSTSLNGEFKKSAIHLLQVTPMVQNILNSLPPIIIK